MTALIHWLVPVTDAFRAWGGFAGLIGLADAWTWWRRWRGGERQSEVIIGWLFALGLALGSLFLILAGFSIPMSNKIAGWSQMSLTQSYVILFAWVCISSGGWALVIARAGHQRLMRLTAACALPAIMLASLLTARV